MRTLSDASRRVENFKMDNMLQWLLKTLSSRSKLDTGCLFGSRWTGFFKSVHSAQGTLHTLSNSLGRGPVYLISAAFAIEDTSTMVIPITNRFLSIKPPL